MASQARKLPIQANLSLTEVVNHLEKRGDLADADALLQANGVSMASSAFDLKALKEELLDRKSKERADKMTNLRSKQMQILASRKGRELELAELQRAEEEQRELLLKDREERELIKKELYCMKKHNLDLMQRLDRVQQQSSVLSQMYDNLLCSTAIWYWNASCAKRRNIAIAQNDMY
eukprot:12423-Heterococcus_DN1.PRE.1